MNSELNPKVLVLLQFVEDARASTKDVTDQKTRKALQATLTAVEQVIMGLGDATRRVDQFEAPTKTD